MHHREHNERVSQSGFSDLCGAWGGAFLVIGGALGFDDNKDLSYFIMGCGFIMSSYFLYEYARPVRAVKIELPSEFADTRKQNATKKILPSIKAKPIDPVMKKIINGEQKRHQKKKITWFDLIQQVFALPLINLVNKKNSDKTRISSVENIPHKETNLRPLPSHENKKVKNFIGNIQIINNSERSKPASTTNLMPSSFHTISKSDKPKKSTQKRAYKPIINSDESKTIVAVTKGLEPICGDEDKQKQLIQQWQIEKNHLEQKFKDNLELIAHKDKEISESQKRNKELAQLILLEQKINAETAQRYILLENSFRNKNQQLLEVIDKLNGNPPQLVKYAHETDSEQEPSSFPPSMPLLNPAGFIYPKKKKDKDHLEPALTNIVPRY